MWSDVYLRVLHKGGSRCHSGRYGMPPPIFTNTLYNSNKYISLFGQIHLIWCYLRVLHKGDSRCHSGRYETPAMPPPRKARRTTQHNNRNTITSNTEIQITNWQKYIQIHNATLADIQLGWYATLKKGQAVDNTAQQKQQKSKSNWIEFSVKYLTPYSVL